MTLAVLTGAASIALLQSLVSIIPGMQTPVPESSNAFESFWAALGKMLSLGTAVTYGDRVLAIIYWFAGLTVMGSIFAFRTVALNRTIERLKAAPSPILDRGHTLILGWSPRVFTILRELAVANQNVRKPLVVVFANEDRGLMDSQIALRSGNLGKLRVITRKGDPTSPVDLQRANVAGAKSVIVLDSDRSGDSMIVSTVLAARAVSEGAPIRFVAEVDDANTAEALEASTMGQVVAVVPRDVIAKITAQASRQPGIPSVILELLDFAGDEIYFTEVPALVGKTYFEAQLSFAKSALMGVVPVGKKPVLNPPHDYKLAASDKLIAIAEDDDKVIYTGPVVEVRRPRGSKLSSRKAKPKRLLVIGWSVMGKSVLSELAEFLATGSTADIVSNPRYVEDELVGDKSFGKLKVNHIRSTGELSQLENLVAKTNYDEILILGYRGEGVSEQEADGQTLLTTMQLTKLFDKELSAGTAPRMVAEILDPLKVELAQTSSVDDLVVSENLAGLLVSQLSENPQLATIFKDLFDPTIGSAIHVRDIQEYVPLGKSVTFADLIAAASAKGETALGWRTKQESGTQRVVTLNPAKDQLITPAPLDGLIVIGRSV